MFHWSGDDGSRTRVQKSYFRLIFYAIVFFNKCSLTYKPFKVFSPPYSFEKTIKTMCFLLHKPSID